MTAQSNNDLGKIFAELQNTASWQGIAISSVHDRNDYNDTPLHTACSWGELPPVRILVLAGSDVNAIGDKGFSPLFKAVVGGNAEVVDFLIKKGANKKLKNDWGGTAFAYASAVSSNPLILKLLKV